LPRVKIFYEKVFEISLERFNSSNELESWTFPMSFEHYGCSGALVKMAGFQPLGNSTLIYFSSHV
jgi:predicted enzyme related to lactoylglutathione lyase